MVGLISNFKVGGQLTAGLMISQRLAWQQLVLHFGSGAMFGHTLWAASWKCSSPCCGSSLRPGAIVETPACEDDGGVEAYLGLNML
jgi:hypothetical protein